MLEPVPESSLPDFSLPIHKIDFVAPLDSNDCGECTACCDILGIQELGKPYYARCAHLGSNCTIYETRPAACRCYRCAWHLGLLGDRPDWRPDKLGLLIELNSEGVGTRINVFEVQPGALAVNESRLTHLLTRLRSNRAVKKVHFARVAVGLFPYGADLPLPFPIAEVYNPYATPEGPLPMDTNREKGIARFTGATHPLLQPRRK